ncbi:MAG: hypothetical protein ACRDPE_11950 [Solirubrobacterales bacterium]
MTNDNGAPRAIEAEEVEAIQNAAADGREELFMRAVESGDAYKIAYGAPLFANRLKPFWTSPRWPKLRSSEGASTSRARRRRRPTSTGCWEPTPRASGALRHH